MGVKTFPLIKQNSAITHSLNGVKEQKTKDYGSFAKPLIGTDANIKDISTIALKAILTISALSTITALCAGLPIAIITANLSFTLTVSAISFVASKTFCSLQVNIVSQENLPSFFKKLDSNTSALVCENSKESFLWKKKLIEEAKENIVLSGNYCGGEAFDEILDLFEGRLKTTKDKQKPIQISLLSSVLFWSEEQEKRIEDMQKDFPEQFIVIKTDDMWQLNPSLKKTNNHTKGLSIDNGKYFILGGSGVEDKYSYHEGVGDRVKPEGPHTGDSFGMAFVRAALPRGFRDMDFVFRSSPSDEKENSVGQRAHHELLKLATLYSSRNSLSYFHSKTPPLEDLTKKMLTEFEQNPKLGDVEVSDFQENVAKDCDTRIYATGPELDESPFLRDLIEKVKAAEREILIDHMFFHPTAELFDALVQAAEGGIEVKIVTNGNEKFSPGAHRLFGDRNRYNYISLFKQISESNRKNLEVYEYGCKHNNTPRKTTLHKKMVIIDDTVMAGSSNLGYKSLETMSDYEINFSVTSRAFAKKARAVFDTDIKMKRAAHDKNDNEILDKKGEVKKFPLSRKITDFSENDTTETMIKASRHKLLAPLFG
jgi:phosphatidylserine/phosphatidylglycerophosphate/cardiolipin synthase-like enzyme